MNRTALIFVIVFSAAQIVSADSFLPPCPSITKSADSTKHFVMLTEPVSNECGGRSDEEQAAAKEIRKKFTASGVYENGDPAKPLWTFNEAWWLGQVHLANDGVHIVHINVTGSDSSATAFTIYKNGNVLREYKINEFLRDESAATKTMTMFLWLKDSSIDDSTSTFNVETKDDLRYSIDLATGKIHGQFSPSCFGIVLISMLIAFGTLYRKR